VNSGLSRSNLYSARSPRRSSHGFFNKKSISRFENTDVVPQLGALDAARVAHHQSCLNASRVWETGAVFLDISKAYDHVHGILLLDKLFSRYVLPRFLGSWINSWLYNRTLAVRFHWLLVLFNRSCTVHLKVPHSQFYSSSPTSTRFLSETMIYSSWTIAA
jgi:hypothetical protein